jgi:hypothetical protein
MTGRQLRRGQCSARGDWGAHCTEYAGHDYAHYDATEDVSWTDHTEDHRDGCTCDCCQPEETP